MSRSRLVAIGGLLMLASAINYMDRQTLATVGTRITQEYALSERQYGAFESSFGFAFAAGSLVFGALADRVSVRLLYPLVLCLWSAVGFLTGLATTYDQLLVCRGVLGFFEAGHWPCGVKVTQLLLSPSQRSMGNGVLQSGTSIGAIITPLIMISTLTPEPGSWRFGFQMIGAAGLIWIIAWFAIVKPGDVRGAPSNGDLAGDRPWWRELASRKMLTCLIVISLINATWQTLRAWLPKILQQDYGYPETTTFYFTSLWYAVTDIGCLGSGALALFLSSRGWRIARSRFFAFALCAFLCSFLMLMPFLAAGPILLAVLLAAGAGALGLFPIYHAFTQDITAHHQGKVTGLAGVVGWTLSSPTAVLFGELADRTGSFRTGMVFVGVIPLIALSVLVMLWPVERS